LIAYVEFMRPGPTGDEPGIAVGRPAPDIAGTAIDGTVVRLSALRGHPVLVNFWGPSCVPCRDEFPLFSQELGTHADDGLAILGVLMFDPPETARDFIADFGATWPTIDDPNGTIRTAYRAVARPQTYFIDAAGIVRAIQVGQTTAADFERQYAKIAP
jgi:peroxiredoxin